MTYVEACYTWLAVARSISTNPREKNLPALKIRSPMDFDNLDLVTQHKLINRLGKPPWMRQEDYDLS